MKDGLSADNAMYLGDYLLSFLYKSNIPYVREVSRSGYGITGAYGKPATLMEGG